jgi:hypothetical protein
MDDLKVLPFLQRLSVLNVSFSVSYRRVSIHQLSPFWTPPLLSLRFADSGGEAVIHHPIVMTGHFIPPYRLPISGTRS